MASEWRERPLGELVDNFDGRRVPVKEPDRRPGPFPYYGASGIVDRIDSYLFDGEYLLIAEDGENLRTRNTPVAFLARGKFWVNNHAHVVRGNSEADTRFLMYALAARNISGFLTGSTMPKLTQGNLNRITVPAPPLDEQRAIATTLGALDDRIELNRRMSETLDQMARVAFQGWFFGGRGSQDWRRVSLGSVCRRVAMGPFGSDITTDNFVPDGVPVVRGKNLVTGFVDDDFVFLKDSKADQLRNANAWAGDIIITHRGTLGQVGLVPQQSRYPRYVVSQSQLVLSVDTSQASPHFIYYLLTSPYGQSQLLANTSQTGVPAIARPTTSVKAIELLLPPRELIDRFEQFASVLSAKIRSNSVESRTLAAMRESLLPALMSGAIRLGSVRDVQTA